MNDTSIPQDQDLTRLLGTDRGIGRLRRSARWLAAAALIALAVLGYLLLRSDDNARFTPPANSSITPEQGGSFVAKLLPRPPRDTSPKPARTSAKGTQQVMNILGCLGYTDLGQLPLPRRACGAAVAQPARAAAPALPRMRSRA
jgi:hypothetical protein